MVPGVPGKWRSGTCKVLLPGTDRVPGMPPRGSREPGARGREHCIPGPIITADDAEHSAAARVLVPGPQGHLVPSKLLLRTVSRQQSRGTRHEYELCWWLELLRLSPYEL